MAAKIAAARQCPTLQAHLLAPFDQAGAVGWARFDNIRHRKRPLDVCSKQNAHPAMVPAGMLTRESNSGAGAGVTVCVCLFGCLLVCARVRLSCRRSMCAAVWALRYRRCVSWRDCMPGIPAMSSTHAIVLEAPSQHLESQHPIRPSIFPHTSVKIQILVD